MCGPDRLRRLYLPHSKSGGGGGGAAAAAGGGEDELVFEDPYADDYESDGEVVDAAAEGEGEGDAEAAAAAAAAGEAVDALEEQLRVWRPGIDTLGEDEVGCPLSRRPSPRR